MANNDSPTKVVIPKEELEGIQNKLSCTQPGCGKIFTSSSNLSMHLWKSHKLEDKSLKISSSEKSDPVQYHCPVERCKYSMELGRFFPLIKLLKQHYLHSHASRDFKCDTCGVFFPTQAARNYHSKSCGCQCMCSCGKMYNNTPALKVHASRQRHKIPENYLVKITVPLTQSVESLPAVQLMAAVALSELCKPIQRDAEVQTEIEEKPKRRQITPSKAQGIERKTSQETQTQSTSSTILKRAMMSAKIPVAKTGSKRKRNTQTQTSRKSPKKAKRSTQSNETQTARPSTSTMTTCTSPISQALAEDVAGDAEKEYKDNSPLMEVMSSEQPTVINDVALPEGWINQKSTQTVDFDYPSLETLLSCDYKFQSCETQTDLFDERLLDECDAGFSINTETQTCDELNESLENMYTNMCTQTCDELLSSLDFVDIETQTFGLE